MSEPKINMVYLIKTLEKYNASDIHIKANRPPIFRIQGKLLASNKGVLQKEDVERIIFEHITDKNREILEKNLQADFSFQIENHGSFRCNTFYQKSLISAVIRKIPDNAPNLEEINVPSSFINLCKKKRGFILITGPTGSGKSTTLNGLIQYINKNLPVHVITIEDPIEFVFSDIKASITQREVGLDCHNFDDALFAGLRQDPDVIVLGEIRDAKTIRTALSAAETGHLVISTLHTNGAKETIERILDYFPTNSRNEIRVQLADILVGIFSQNLIPKKDGSGRILAHELLIKTSTVQEYLNKNEINKISDYMVSSKDKNKICTLNHSLIKLLNDGVISLKDAMSHSSNPDELKLVLSGIIKD